MSNVNATSAGEDDGSIIGLKAEPIPRGLNDLNGIWFKIAHQVQNDVLIIKDDVYNVWDPALRRGVLERLE